MAVSPRPTDHELKPDAVHVLDELRRSVAAQAVVTDKTRRPRHRPLHGGIADLRSAICDLGVQGVIWGAPNSARQPQASPFPP